MRTSEVLIRPIVTEKVNQQMEQNNRYSFVVNRKANKLEIKEAVEQFYNVRVDEVNTMIIPAKAKSRFTKAGFVTGRKPAYKKAIVSLAEGEDIDLFMI
ncbi:MAG TPA: 50S ribosomal protein L23 [Chitinophagaceae bacterium]|nr:50S ribosomal protein L23 [Chitinophagaceae bacterium]